MARFRRKKGRRSGKSKSIPLAIAVPVVVNGVIVGKYLMAGDTKHAVNHITGFDMGSGKMEWSVLATTYGPIVAGAVIHKAANKFGVNNMVRRATMGYLSL